MYLVIFWLIILASFLLLKRMDYHLSDLKSFRLTALLSILSSLVSCIIYYILWYRPQTSWLVFVTGFLMGFAVFILLGYSVYIYYRFMKKRIKNNRLRKIVGLNPETLALLAIFVALTFSLHISFFRPLIEQEEHSTGFEFYGELEFEEQSPNDNFYNSHVNFSLENIADIYIGYVEFQVRFKDNTSYEYLERYPKDRNVVFKRTSNEIYFKVKRIEGSEEPYLFFSVSWDKELGSDYCPLDLAQKSTYIRLEDERYVKIVTES